jgi:Ribbon-helix-helix protein, copG family
MKVMKVTGFNLRREDEETLQQLSAKLGWNRSQIIRELLARAVVQGPSVDVALPSAVSNVQVELERETFGVLD